MLAHAHGGTSETANLTTLHAMCNTRKPSLAAESLPFVTPGTVHHSDWDGLLSHYADIVGAGETTGRRYSAAGYHQGWLRRFEGSSLARQRESRAAT
ncbi:hypothetical protein [Microbacterium aurugineum]|uniref:HNH domain-containing protein n=1 Tax=Microbacterium aurugineum TaxID=2851642 RepID=A0ABY4IXT7_9MICO|nr:hypothetical protein [Microbacterium aurugineum]UPL17497.1 hypothetical protein KV397_06895 [Microbacterium aurugineum]